MNIPDIRIECPDDKGVEMCSLKNFPCVPVKGDIIKIYGVEREVVERSFETNKGAIDGKVDGLVLKLKTRE